MGKKLFVNNNHYKNSQKMYWKSLSGYSNNLFVMNLQSCNQKKKKQFNVILKFYLF